MLRGTNEKKNLIYWNSELYFMIIFLVLTCVKTDVIRDITGEFQYVSTMNFKVVGETLDGASFQFALRQKIQEMYIQTMNDDSIWIEIIKLHDLRSHERRKRASIRDISAEYIIHTTEKKNETELRAIAEVYKKQKCSNETNNCQVGDIHGISMVFNPVIVPYASAMCSTTRNYCDEKTSTCSSDEGKLECLCNEGYEKSNTNSLQCFDKDECANYQACPLGTACSNTVGSWDCWCPKGLKAIETSPGKKECQDPCIHAKCLIKPTCRHFDNEDGYICRCQKGRKGKYCQEIDYDLHESNFKTTMYIICGTLGGIAVICIFIIIGVCRKRLPQIQNSSSRTSSGGQTIPNNASNVLDIPMSNQPQRQKAGRSKGAPQRGKTNKRNAEKGRGLQSNSYRYGQRADSTDYNISHLTRDEHQYETIRDDHVYDTIHTYVNM